MAPGNTQSHAVKLVLASNGTDVIGGSATVNTSGGTAGNFAYANLAYPITLAANTSYYVLSQETDGQDKWYDYDTTVTTTSVATVDYATYILNGNYVNTAPVNHEFVPVDFIYTTGALPSRFVLWEQGYFNQQDMADPSVTGEAADPDSDALGNLLEYAFNLDPTQPSTTNRPYTVQDSTYLSLIYVKVLAATDLTYAVEQSLDLQGWSTVTPVNVVLSDDGVTQLIKAQVPLSNAGAGGKLFLHLSVTH